MNDARQPGDAEVPATVQGGRERGLVLHKLLEEVLTGETADNAAALNERARFLISALGKPLSMTRPQGFLRPNSRAASRGLLPCRKSPPCARRSRRNSRSMRRFWLTIVEQATVGIADAMALGRTGRPESSSTGRAMSSQAPKSSSTTAPKCALSRHERNRTRADRAGYVRHCVDCHALPCHRVCRLEQRSECACHHWRG